MLRKLIKSALILIIFCIGTATFGVLKEFGSGTLVLIIVGTGTGAAITAVWKYNPTSKEIALKKED